MKKKLVLIISVICVFCVVGVLLMSSLNAGSEAHEAESSTNKLKYAKVNGDFVEFNAKKDSYVEMKKVNSSLSGEVDLTFHYSAEKSFPLELKVNGKTICRKDMISPENTTVTYKADLNAGSTNKIRFKIKDAVEDVKLDKVVIGKNDVVEPIETKANVVKTDSNVETENSRRTSPSPEYVLTEEDDRIEPSPEYVVEEEIELIDSKPEKSKEVSDPTKEVDGKLDDFCQGDVGDCGAVSAIEALDNSVYGNSLLEDLIISNSDGSYTVNFAKGEELVSQQDVAKGYISGDYDARVIEAGLDNSINVYQSCFAYQCFETITGYNTDTVTGTSSKNDLMSYMENKCADNEGIIAACDFTTADDSKGIIGDGGHSYSIKEVNDDEIIIVNPWDTSKNVVISRDQFVNSIRYMTCVDEENKEIIVYWE